MKETRPQCTRCRHQFHAMASCGNYDYDSMKPCDCLGVWHDATKAISGFCYVLVGVTRDTERASHASCPGVDYYYPCECDCHDAVSGG